MTEKYNFSKFKFFAILILTLIGIALCIELSIIFYKTNFLVDASRSFCAISELIDCDGVAKTPYSLSMGVPNAIWGLILYLVFLMLLFVDRIQNKFKNTIFDVFENPSSYIASLALLSFGISMILAFISIFKIHKICTLCFCTYIIDLFIAFFAKGKGFFIEDIKTTIKDFIKGAKKYFALFIIVLIAFISTLIYLDRSLILSPKLKKERINKEFYEATYNKYAVKGNFLGKKDAKITINIYSDYNCPFCRITNTMIHKAAKEESIKVNEYNFPIDTKCNKKVYFTLGGHESSCLASKYALAAKKQEKFWDVSNVLFYKSYQTDDDIINFLKEAKIDMDYDKLRKDANSESVNKELQSEIELVHSLGVNGTPTLEINGVMYLGGMPYDELITKIKTEIKRESK